MSPSSTARRAGALGDSAIRLRPELAPEVEDDFDGDQFDREERQALRRVVGLSTELTDVTEVEYRQLRLERVVLVGVWTEGTIEDAENSMAELAALAETAGSQVLEGLMQRRDRPDPATYIGSGKANELREVVLASGADTVICDGELSPAQLNALEKVVKVKVIDRTALILDIFAQHAHTREGRAQVSLAQMEYMLPRLRGWGESMSRQAGGAGGGAGGGVGTRGPGETKIETDRRRIRERMAKLRREIKGMKQARDTKRASRRRNEVPSVAIAGYTNAGKSSLLNRLTGAGVLVENALFATLDPTTRRTEAADGREYTLSDTVGFVRHLPHQLVEAFRSTLEEVADADLLVHVVDGSHPDPIAQVNAVREVLADIEAAQVPEMIVVNKADAASPEALLELRQALPGALVVSAHTGFGIDELRAAIEERLPRPALELHVRLPYDQGGLVSRIHAEGEVLSSEHTTDGTELHVRVHPGLAAALQPYAGTSQHV
ncbi:GTPase HflX [Cryptosporangium aurantiacum]|uniref:GTPase HflX n=1 Tax=Cryptosporangium aurantiacum TaxID=134849 RepID=A0A1M7IXF8_9ACTN|nr:GTPase HflX [Cryptosporangium aurantiacum]SHM45365.1 GTP-binding protein HflX [Cryptosporangium aurantiacum]